MVSVSDAGVTWESKVIGYTTMPPEQLLANPFNFRRHPAKQREALRGSLNELGWIAPVLVNKLTGNMLDGHARVEEALSAGVAEVPVVIVEVPPEKEKLALLSLDPIAALAENDRAILEECVAESATSEPGLQAMLSDMVGMAGGSEGQRGGGSDSDSQVTCPHCGERFSL